MLKKIVLLSFFIQIVIVLFGLTLKVRQDGSTSYSTIQSAINASANCDTVLVYPGTYYENVDYIGKNITLASLVLTTGIIAYRDSTIIDGHNSGACVVSDQNTSQASLIGFTIRNGSGKSFTDDYGTLTRGGGIYIDYSLDFYISSCLIINNIGDFGGGINVHESTLHLSDNILTNNFSLGGGGLFATNLARVIFDQINRCSIYENYAGAGSDISNSYSRYDMEVYLDKATINPSTDYYMSSIKFPGQPGDITVIDILQAYRTEINQDLYVSADGDDSFDGLSSFTPLRTISKALHLIQSDSLNSKTVHIASGTYSTDDGQIYPLSPKRYTMVIGDSLNIPVIENKKYNYAVSAINVDYLVFKNFKFAYGNFQPYDNIGFSMGDNIKVSNIYIDSFTAGRMGAIAFGECNFELENLYLNNIKSAWDVAFSMSSSNGKLKNIFIDNCHSTNAYDGVGIIYATVDTVLTIENMSVTNCSNLDTDFALVSVGATWNNPTRISIKNSLFANNSSRDRIPIHIGAWTNEKTSELINCTFSNNRGLDYAVALNGNWKIKNTIFNDNPNYQLTIYTDDNTPQHAQLDNCFVKGYPSSLPQLGNGIITVNENILTGFPRFRAYNLSDPLSYQLHYSSPLINAGTADTTGLNLPDFDLLGNDRIYGGRIDIGCYEWDGNMHNEQSDTPVTGFNLNNYPNPFNPSTTISYVLQEKGLTDVSVYNVKGQKIRNLKHGYSDKGVFGLVWDGKADTGKNMTSGLYFVRISHNGKQAVRKVVMVK